MNTVWQYEELAETPGMGEIVQYETNGEEIIHGIRQEHKLRRVIARDVSRETWEAIQAALDAQEDLRGFHRF